MKFEASRYISFPLASSSFLPPLPSIISNVNTRDRPPIRRSDSLCASSHSHNGTSRRGVAYPSTSGPRLRGAASGVSSSNMDPFLSGSFFDPSRNQHCGRPRPQWSLLEVLDRQVQNWPDNHVAQGSAPREVAGRPHHDVSVQCRGRRECFSPWRSG